MKLRADVNTEKGSEMKIEKMRRKYSDISLPKIRKAVHKVMTKYDKNKFYRKTDLIRKIARKLKLDYNRQNTNRLRNFVNSWIHTNINTKDEACADSKKNILDNCRKDIVQAEVQSKTINQSKDLGESEVQRNITNQSKDLSEAEVQNKTTNQSKDLSESELQSKITNQSKSLNQSEERCGLQIPPVPEAICIRCDHICVKKSIPLIDISETKVEIKSEKVIPLIDLTDDDGPESIAETVFNADMSDINDVLNAATNQSTNLLMGNPLQQRIIYQPVMMWCPPHLFNYNQLGYYPITHNIRNPQETEQNILKCSTTENETIDLNTLTNHQSQNSIILG